MHSAPGDRWTVRAASCRRQNCGGTKSRSRLPLTLEADGHGGADDAVVRRATDRRCGARSLMQASKVRYSDWSPCPIASAFRHGRVARAGGRIVEAETPSKRGTDLRSARRCNDKHARKM